jgi:hypothetical protein
MHRRTILQLLGSAAISLGWRPSLSRAQAAPQSGAQKTRVGDPGPLDAAGVDTLRAIAPAVLPSALGPVGADKVVDGFLVWLRGYKPGADMGYGYGILRKRVTPAITPATYREQLAGLERAARSSSASSGSGGSLGTLSMDARRAVVTEALDAAGVKALPGIPDGGHVIADFMSFYFHSSEANDLCHQAKIGREKCRTLAGSSRRPDPLRSA